MACTQIEIIVHGKDCPDKREYLYHYHGFDDVVETNELEPLLNWIREDLLRMIKERNG